jgi:hypothetical protein
MVQCFFEWSSILVFEIVNNIWEVCFNFEDLVNIQQLCNFLFWS